MFIGRNSVYFLRTFTAQHFLFHCRSISLPRTGFVFLCSFLLLFFSFPSSPTSVPPTRTSETLFLSNKKKMRDVTTKQTCYIPFATQISQHTYKHQWRHRKLSTHAPVRSLRCIVETNASRYNESNVQTGSDFILHGIDTCTWEWQGKVKKKKKPGSDGNFYTFVQFLKQSLSLLKLISFLNWRPPEAREMDSGSSSVRHCAGVWYLGTYKNYIAVNPNAQRFPICVCVCEEIWRQVHLNDRM